MNFAHGPSFDFKNCIGCAAQLVVNARPNRHLQNSHLLYLNKYFGYTQAQIVLFIHSGEKVKCSLKC
jgi:hypothetical protein